jgi:hypothetical protein
MSKNRKQALVGSLSNKQYIQHFLNSTWRLAGGGYPHITLLALFKSEFRFCDCVHARAAYQSHNSCLSSFHIFLRNMNSSLKNGNSLLRHDGDRVSPYWRSR